MTSGRGFANEPRNPQTPQKSERPSFLPPPPHILFSPKTPDSKALDERERALVAEASQRVAELQALLTRLPVAALAPLVTQIIAPVTLLNSTALMRQQVQR